MQKPGWLMLAVVVIALVAGAMLYGQGAGGGRGGDRAGAGAFDRERAQFTLDLLQLSKPEVAAGLRSAEAKWKARLALEEAWGKLRSAGDDSQATDQQLSQAIASYTKAMGSYRTAVQSEDTALVKKSSVRSRARSSGSGGPRQRPGLWREVTKRRTRRGEWGRRWRPGRAWRVVPSSAEPWASNVGGAHLWAPRRPYPRSPTTTPRA